jgi:hypothetical protein
VEQGNGFSPVADGEEDSAIKHMRTLGARPAQAACSARSLIPRSILWLITKLTASTGSTMNRAHGSV